MPELPEIARLAGQMDRHLAGLTVARVETIQPKSLNLPPEDFERALCGATIRRADYRGKWIRVETTQGWLLINLGMGGELLLLDPERLPEKRRVVFYFTNGSCLSVNFWWFGYVHYAPVDALDQHEMLARLGPNVLEVSLEEFRERIAAARGKLKAFLLDQSNLAGIGNAYIHDILFFAGLHPQRRLESLQAEDFEALARGIHDGLAPSLQKGGAFY
ncbi:MAG TPA: DNA-formamidopyrimidine glycosylase family protein, partial [Anaerolineaceae bacterium]|nr:DNA-formamidopyrimidine glycosylase family protein [Anaerolineaceae bacterium]